MSYLVISLAYFMSLALFSQGVAKYLKYYLSPKQVPSKQEN
jgi:hypothetical protein